MARHRSLERPTEALNLLIKKIKRVAHGLRNLNNYRADILQRIRAVAPRLLYTGGCSWYHLGH